VLAIEPGDLPKPIEELGVIRERMTPLRAADDERRRIHRRKRFRLGSQREITVSAEEFIQ
jgi:hypothetical protein